MHSLRLGIRSCLLALPACTPVKDGQAAHRSGAPAVTEAAPGRGNTTLPLDEVMHHVLDPAAYGFWGGIGTSYTEAGERDLSPRTDAEWEKVENGAATVAIASNSLLLDGYRMAPEADWDRHARHVAEVALLAKAAAEHRDKTAMARIGTELDEACEECHKQFSPSPTITQGN